MTDRRLHDELRRASPPDAARARERARAVTLAAYAGAPRRPRPRRLGASLPVAAALLLLLVAGAFAATPPGGAVTDWVRDLVGRSGTAPAPSPALSRLPADGRLLVSGPGGAWVVQADGSRRRLGLYDEATWSPRGLFVAATRGRQLAALEPGGAVRWALARPEAVSDPRWAPSGLRVAYRSGADLRVVAGDGSADRLVARRVRAGTLAWRPAGARNELAYVDRRGRVVLADVDRGRTPARLRPGLTARWLQWSPGGTRLLVAGPEGARLLSGSALCRPRAGATGGQAPCRARAVAVSVRVDAPPGTRLAGAALSPGGGRLALLRRSVRSARHEVLVARPGRKLRSLVTVTGPVRSLTWSPDGRFLLADWTGADQWLFLPTRPGARASAVAGIAAQFDLSRARPRDGVAVEGWVRGRGR